MTSDYIRVFLSSRMEELASERQIVRGALEQIRMRCFVYENDAGARPVTAERTFLSELQNADVYIGLFWKGYGQYTIEEYEAARNLRKPCFIYKKYGDLADRDSKLRSFLDELEKVKTGLTVRRFQELDELASAVQDDLAKWIASIVRTGGSAELVPEKLPCLCDRDPQDKAFRDHVLNHFGTKQRRPLLIVLNGHRLEGHTHYIDRVEARSVREWLTLCSLGPSKRVVRIQEPIDDDQPVHEFARDLRKRLAAKLVEPYVEDDTFLASYIRNHRLGAFIAVVTVLASEYQDRTCTFLQRMCEYMSTFPDAPEGTLLSFLVCLRKWETPPSELTDRMTSRLSKFWHRCWSSHGDTALETDLAICRQRYGTDSRVKFIELPPLMSVTPTDVEYWLLRDEVHRYIPFGTSMKVEKIFNGRSSLPMEEACEKLLDLLAPQASA